MNDRDDSRINEIDSPFKRKKAMGKIGLIYLFQMGNTNHLNIMIKNKYKYVKFFVVCCFWKKDEFLKRFFFHNPLKVNPC